ncbi:hypothetical protein [Rhodococcus sp. T7]|uniref:hypothetical protein n=1 Tax=Rhodococcus sp. T7 TaxID=627444 RepID=UPI0013CD67EB|nr:hypothetical protein [Rhodococcus sp. T7]KAF0960029.1 hypothetical protein MLGJGCBP_06879 [Rhodococcus sp. T7]
MSPENVTEPYSVSKRYAKEGNAGPCGTSVAVTWTRSSLITVNGAHGGQVLVKSAPNSGRAISCTTGIVLVSGNPVSRINTLLLYA